MKATRSPISETFIMRYVAFICYLTLKPILHTRHHALDTAVTLVLRGNSMNFGVDVRHDLTADAVDSVQAAAGLGTSRATLLRLRRLGLIPAFSVPSRIPGRVMWRFRLEDLMAFKKKQRNQIHAWDPREDGELPAIVVARILGVSLQDVYIQRHRGRLKDYRPETVRQYALKRLEKEVAREVAQEFKPKLARMTAEYRRLRVVEARLRRLLKENLCESCGEPF
jgi:hypothetical protein